MQNNGPPVVQTAERISQIALQNILGNSPQNIFQNVQVQVDGSGNVRQNVPQNIPQSLYANNVQNVLVQQVRAESAPHNNENYRSDNINGRSGSMSSSGSSGSSSSGSSSGGGSTIVNNVNNNTNNSIDNSSSTASINPVTQSVLVPMVASPSLNPNPQGADPLIPQNVPLGSVGQSGPIEGQNSSSSSSSGSSSSPDSSRAFATWLDARREERDMEREIDRLRALLRNREQDYEEALRSIFLLEGRTAVDGTVTDAVTAAVSGSGSGIGSGSGGSSGSGSNDISNSGIGSGSGSGSSSSSSNSTSGSSSGSGITRPGVSVSTVAATPTTVSEIRRNRIDEDIMRYRYDNARGGLDLNSGNGNLNLNLNLNGGIESGGGNGSGSGIGSEMNSDISIIDISAHTLNIINSEHSDHNRTYTNTSRTYSGTNSNTSVSSTSNNTSYVTNINDIDYVDDAVSIPFNPSNPSFQLFETETDDTSVSGSAVTPSTAVGSEESDSVSTNTGIATVTTRSRDAEDEDNEEEDRLTVENSSNSAEGDSDTADVRTQLSVSTDESDNVSYDEETDTDTDIDDENDGDNDDNDIFPHTETHTETSSNSSKSTSSYHLDLRCAHGVLGGRIGGTSAVMSAAATNGSTECEGESACQQYDYGKDLESLSSGSISGDTIDAYIASQTANGEARKDRERDREKDREIGDNGEGRRGSKVSSIYYSKSVESDENGNSRGSETVISNGNISGINGNVSGINGNINSNINGKLNNGSKSRIEKNGNSNSNSNGNNDSNNNRSGSNNYSNSNSNGIATSNGERGAYLSNTNSTNYERETVYIEEKIAGDGVVVKSSEILVGGSGSGSGSGSGRENDGHRKDTDSMKVHLGTNSSMRTRTHAALRQQDVVSSSSSSYQASQSLLPPSSSFSTSLPSPPLPPSSFSSSFCPSSSSSLPGSGLVYENLPGDTKKESSIISSQNNNLDQINVLINDSTSQVNNQIESDTSIKIIENKLDDKISAVKFKGTIQDSSNSSSSSGSSSSNSKEGVSVNTININSESESNLIPQSTIAELSNFDSHNKNIDSSSKNIDLNGMNISQRDSYGERLVDCAENLKGGDEGNGRSSSGSGSGDGSGGDVVKKNSVDILLGEKEKLAEKEGESNNDATDR